MLNIICISKGVEGLKQTLDSFAFQQNKSARLIFVFRDVDKEHQAFAEKVGQQYVSYSVIKNKCNSITNACNLGILQCDPGHLLFIDAGDFLSSPASIGLVLGHITKYSTCLAFDSHLMWKNKVYLRKVTTGKKPNIGHVGFIGVVDKNTLLGEIASYSSDYDWILKQINKYGYEYCANEVIATFKLGGVSTFPTWMNVLVAVKRESFKTKLKYIMRFTLRLVLGDQGYVKFMMKYNRYEAVDVSGA